MTCRAATARAQHAKKRWKIFGSQSASISLPSPRLQSVLARVSRAKKSASSSMPKLPGVNHLAAVRVFEKIGFIVIRQGKHVTMSDGLPTIQIPRSKRVHGSTIGD